MVDKPVVLLTPGMGGAAYDWELVQPSLAERYRVVPVERPGLDGGEPRRGLPALAEEADRLATAADRCGGAVVVAHSAAALHAEAMGRLHPRSLLGLVLLDPSCGEGAPTAARTLRTAEGLGRRAAPHLTRWGPALWTAIAHSQTSRPLPAAVREAAHVRFRSPAAIAAVWQEYLAFEPMLRDLAALRERTVFPAVPVRVLTGTGGMRTAAAVGWMRCHLRLAQLLAGHQRLLPTSRHHLAWERPHEVLASVESVMGEL